MSSNVYEPERIRNRRLKQEQVWRCARCQSQAGGRSVRGDIVRLSVVERDGKRVALCQWCKLETAG